MGLVLFVIGLCLIVAALMRWEPLFAHSYAKRLGTRGITVFSILVGTSCSIIGILGPIELSRTVTAPLTVPTPYYTPMAGSAFTAPDDFDGTVALWNRHCPPHSVVETLPSGTQVEIVRSVWYHTKNKYHEDMCYMYFVRDPDSGVQGWVEQAGITKDSDFRVPVEYWCAQGGVSMSTPTPLPE